MPLLKCARTDVDVHCTLYTGQNACQAVKMMREGQRGAAATSAQHLS